VWHDLTGHEPIEQVTKRREMLLDGRRRVRGRLQLDPARDMQRPYGGNRRHAGAGTPREKVTDSVRIGPPRVRVANVRSKKLDKAHTGPLAGRDDQCRCPDAIEGGELVHDPALMGLDARIDDIQQVTREQDDLDRFARTLNRLIPVRVRVLVRPDGPGEQVTHGFAFPISNLVASKRHQTVAIWRHLGYDDNSSTEGNLAFVNAHRTGHVAQMSITEPCCNRREASQGLVQYKGRST
jgi:hypothetical protein